MVDPFETEGLNLNIEDWRLEGYSRQREEGDALLSILGSGEAVSPPIGRGELKILGFLMTVCVALFFARTFYLQAIKGDHYYYISEGKHMRIETIRASRGLFIDRNNKPLVKNIPAFSLNIIPANLTKDQIQYQIITQTVNQTLSSAQQKEFVSNLEALPKYAVESIPVVSDLDYQTAILLKIKLEGAGGFEVVTNNTREYDDPLAFSHLFGHLGRVSKEELMKHKEYLFNDSIGKSGLELFYEDQLRGKNGQQRVEISRAGNQEEITHSQQAVPGSNLILNLDAESQKKLFDLLSVYVRQSGGKGGAAVALNPNSGEVLAIISYPSYDNNILSRGPSSEEFSKIVDNPNKPLFFRTIAGEYPSGSTIKPVMAAAALAEKIITPATTVFSSGGVTVGKWFFADWKSGGHGVTNVIKALAESVNTFFYYIGGGYNDFNGLGVEKIDHWLSLFGLGSPTQIDLSGEWSGFLPTPEWKKKEKNDIWYPGDTYHLSIGQGDLLVTPLQVANYTVAIANDGTLYQPQIVNKIINSNKKEIIKIQPKILRSNFIKSEYLQTVREGMRAAVVSGSARSLSTLPLSVAAKTGTAQNPSGRTHAWFTCFAPYDKPEIVLTVLIENGGEGSAAAAPVAREFLKWWYQQKIDAQNKNES